MTSPTTPGSAQQDLEGRSVRDVVEYSPGQVNDAWCRKIFRKILQSLELQYAMHMPHRVITPDTIVFHANGEPLLISDDIDAAPAEDARQADDLTALARVLHYAITQELAPTGPLVGRADGYSAALIATVDACMDPDPTRRPPCVDAVRNLLGIAASAPPAGAVTMPEVQVPPGPRLDAPIVTEASGAGMVAAPKVPTAAIGSAPTGAADDSAARVPGAPVVSSLPSSASTLPQLPSAPLLAAASAPPDAPDASVEAHHAGVYRGRRWAIAAGGGAIAVTVALLLSAELRDTGPRERVASTPSQAAGAPQRLPAAESGAASTGTVAAGAPTDQIANAASDDPVHTAATVAASDATGSKVGRMARSTDAGLTGNPAGDSVGNPASGSSSRGATRSGGADPHEGTTEVKSKRAGATGSAAEKVPPAASARVAAAPPPKDGTAVRARAALPPSAVPGKASYQLQIVPWGVVYVDGVDHGVSPPLRRLALTPGRHTIRITNPKYRDSILEFDSAQTTSIGKIIVEFADDPQ